MLVILRLYVGIGCDSAIIGRTLSIYVDDDCGCYVAACFGGLLRFLATRTRGVSG